MKVTAGAAKRAFWQTRGQQVNLALSDLVLAQTGAAPRSAVFSFSRQMQGTGEIVTALLAALLDGENMDVMLRGVWLDILATAWPGG